MKQIKAPKEVQEIFFEATACRALSEDHDRGWLPSLKAIYYRQKAIKAESFAWRALKLTHPETDIGEWFYNGLAGMLVKDEETPAAAKPKKTRKPKVVASAINPGEPA